MPKKIKNLFYKNLTFKKLLDAHYRARKNKAYKKDVILFEMNLENNIINLLNSIKNNNYKMGKYYDFKICGYYLYFTAHCIIECMHVHASDRKLTEGGSAKFFVKSNGDTVIQNRGVLTDRELNKIQSFIKDNYKEMYLKWASMSENGFFGEN